MYKSLPVLLISLFAHLAAAQTPKEQAYQKYSRLVDGKWESKGRWEKGGEYHQVVEITHQLNKAIFTATTQDFIDGKQFENHVRNYGIRAWDEKEGKMKFWEFDAFGGVISGDIEFRGNDIFHIYLYPSKSGGSMMLADAWIFVDDNHYELVIGEYKNGTLGTIYMKSSFRRIGDKAVQK